MDSVAQCPAHVPIDDDGLLAAPATALCAACRDSFAPTGALITGLEQQPDPIILYTRGAGRFVPPVDRYAGYEWAALGVLAEEEPIDGLWRLAWPPDGGPPLPKGWPFVRLWEIRLYLPSSPLYAFARSWPGCTHQLVGFGGLEQPHKRKEHKSLPALLEAFNALPPIMRPLPGKPKGSGRYPTTAAFKGVAIPIIQDQRRRGWPTSAEALAPAFNVSKGHLHDLVKRHTGHTWRAFVETIPPPPRSSRLR